MARTLHWLMAALVLFQIATGLVMVYEGPEGNLWSRLTDVFDLYSLHKLLGLVLLALVLIRIAYRVSHGAPPDEPTIEVWQQEASHFVHAWIYFLLILIPLLGWLGISLYPAVLLFGAFEVPSLVPADRAKSAAVFAAHAYAAFTLVGLIILHISAALYHHFVRGDDVLRRMLPGLRERKDLN